MPSKEILYQNKKLHYKIEGTGNPLVLIHGFAEDGNIWKLQSEALSKDFKVIVPDLPGSGLSEALDIENLSIDDLAKAIDAVVEAEGLRDFIMIGHSMGGYITLAYEEMYPQKAKSFGLFHSTAYADNDIKIQNRKKAIEFIKANGNKPFLKTIIPDLYYNSFDKTNNIENHLAISNKIEASVLIQYYHAMINRKDRTIVLKNSNKPVLFVGGSYDLLIPFKQTIKESCYADCAVISILKKSAHMGMIEENEFSNNIISAFINFTNTL